LAAGLRPDPLGELTALPQTPSCIKGGERREMGMKDRWKGPFLSTGKQRKQREKRDQGEKGRGTWNKGEMCPTLWKCVIDNHIDLPP